MISRFSNFFRYPSNLSNLVEHTKSFYETYEGTESLNEKFNSSVLTAEKVVKGFLALNFISFLLPVSSTFIFYLFTYQKITISPIYLPLTEMDSDFGYCLNNILLLMLCFVGFLGFSTHDGTFILYGYQSVTFVDILCVKLDEFAVTLNTEAFQCKQKKKIMDQFKEIVKMYGAYQKLISILVIFSSIPSFVGLVVNVLVICLCIVGAVKVSFIAGVAAAIGLFIQIAIPCFIGNLINLQNERFVRALYDLPWYKIDDIEARKMFLQFLLFSQKSENLSLPMMGKMSMELLRNIINAIYSYTMFIYKFVI